MLKSIKSADLFEFDDLKNENKAVSIIERALKTTIH